jgi:hypothetical protein
MTKFETIDEIIFAVAILAIEEEAANEKMEESNSEDWADKEALAAFVLRCQKRSEKNEAIQLLKSKCNIETLKATGVIGVGMKKAKEKIEHILDQKGELGMKIKRIDHEKTKN